MAVTTHPTPLIALFGLPNSGKSTLLNRLTSTKTAIVAREAHTTRDLNFGETEWEGMYLRFVDTGGLVPNPTDIIQKQIQIKSWSALQEADILVWVIDRRQNPDTIHEAIIKRVWSLGKPFVICINKVDDPNISLGIDNHAHLGGFDFINVSSTNGLGVDLLLDSLVSKSLKIGFKKIQTSDIAFIEKQKKPKKLKSKKLVTDKEGNFVVLRENSEAGPGMFFSATDEEEIINPIKNIVVDLGKTLFYPNSFLDINLGLQLFLEEQKDKGINVFYITNQSGDLLVKRIGQLPNLFAGGFAATTKNFDKTNPEFYSEFLEHYNLKSQETIYFDDDYKHIQTAQSVGIWSQQFLFDKTNPAAFLESVEFGKVQNKPPVPTMIMLGKPNVGKSSLFNRILDKDVQIVTSVAGTTLSVNEELLVRNSKYQYKDNQGKALFEVPLVDSYKILDSTGLRKVGQRTMGVETFATYRTIEAAHKSDIVCFVMDCSTPITHQDQVVAGICQDVGKGIVLVLNKVDLITPEERKKFLNSFTHKFAFLKVDNIVFTSASEDLGIEDFWSKVDNASFDQSKNIPKEEVRKLFNYLMKKKPPNKLRNQKKAVIYDLVFKSNTPPTFELLVKDKKAIHWSWTRFLENTIRRQFHFLATGIKVKVVEVDRKKVI